MDRYDPYLDPDAEGCPYGCGRLTDDPYGGPCSACWARLDETDDRDALVGYPMYDQDFPEGW